MASWRISWQNIGGKKVLVKNAFIGVIGKTCAIQKILVGWDSVVLLDLISHYWQNMGGVLLIIPIHF